MKKSISLLILMFLLCSSGFSQTRIKTLFYNLLYYPSGEPNDREVTLKSILDTYNPDIFTVCELETAEGADEILSQSIKSSRPNFARATFVTNQSDPSADNQLHQLLFYNTDLFTLENEQVHPTSIRDINQYTLILKSEDAEVNPIRIEYFVTHFKSSDGTANKNLRLDMAKVFTAVLENLDPDTYVVFSGDFNFYTSSEPAYQELLDLNNNIVMIDPMHDNSYVQSWTNDTPTYAALHTQATRKFQQNGNGAFSGMDDRFDFSFISKNLTTSSELYIIPDTYDAYGNNKNCFDKDINDATCTGEYSQSLRNDLYIMSDHTPVVMELETTKTILNIDKIDLHSQFNIIGSNLINSIVSIQISSDFYNSTLLIHNQLGQLVKTIDTTIDNQILTDVSSLSNGMYIITSSNINFTKPIKFLKVN